MRKSNPCLQPKSKWFLNSSRLILGLIILSLPTQGFAMEREDSPTKKRLQAKLRAKRGETVPTSLARTMGALDRATQFMRQEGETGGRIADRRDADVLSLVQKRKISVSEREKINVEFRQRNLDLSQVKSVKEGFLKSVESELNFVRSASENLDNERDFFLDRNPAFNKEGAFASDLLHHNNPLRKRFILTIQPFAKGGIGTIESFQEKFSAEDPTSYRCIMQMYIGLCSLAEANLEGSKTALAAVDFTVQQASISRKAKRLLSIIYDGGVLRALDAADILQPYATAIAKAINLPEMNQVTTRARQVREFVIARQRETRRGPSISPVLLELLRERMVLRDQELTSPPKEMPVISRALPLRPTLEQEPTVIMPTRHNLKGEYREPSAEEVRREKKKEAKQRKKEAAALQAENDRIQSPRSEIKVTGEETSLEESAKEIAPVQIGGNFKTFERLMNQTYKGPIEKVVLLFERLGGNVEEWHSGSRIKFSLPHFANLQTELLDILPPQTEDEEEIPPQPVSTGKEEAVFHGPHKQKSNKLRPYHVNDIREMLIRAGYNEKTVVKKIQ